MINEIFLYDDCFYCYLCLVSVKTVRGDWVLAESPVLGVTDVTLVLGDEQCPVSQHSSAALAALATEVCKSEAIARHL